MDKQRLKKLKLPSEVLTLLCTSETSISTSNTDLEQSTATTDEEDYSDENEELKQIYLYFLKYNT